MSYTAFGAEPSPENGGTATPGLPDDVATSAVHQIVSPLQRRRGWVAVPTFDVRQYVQTQFMVAAIGFGVGVTVGAILGDIFGGKRIAPVTKILGNRRRRVRRNAGKRRTTARKRKRGRPTVKAVARYDDHVKLPDGYYRAVIERGSVFVGKPRRRPDGHDPRFTTVPIGTVYDAGTTFRSVPHSWDAPVREFSTLAGAVKHLIREKAA